MVKYRLKGRLGNHLCIFNAAFILAKKYFLFLETNEYLNECFECFNINPEINGTKFNTFIPLESDYEEDLQYVLSATLKANCGFYIKGYTQASNIFYLHKQDTQKLFNTYEQTQNTEDVFIHYRLGDLHKTPWAMPYEYFDEALQTLKWNKIYLSSDSPNDWRIKKLKEKYNIEIYNNTPEKTLKFASTFNQLILSEGTFSWWIQHLSSANKIIVPERNYGIKYTDPNCIFLPWTYKECLGQPELLTRKVKSNRLVPIRT